MTKWVYVLINYEGQDIRFSVQLPADTNLAEYEEELRNNIYIEFEECGLE